MIRFGALILVLLVSFTISLPTCNLSYWISSDNTTCSTSPNGTYSAMTYNGSCTLSPHDPEKTTYKLIIDVDTKTVQNFTVYDNKNCDKTNNILIAKTPLSLDSCGLLYFITDTPSFVQIGTLVFNCQD
jgi:hypothetical protein